MFMSFIDIVLMLTQYCNISNICDTKQPGLVPILE